jgi:hypothetical protein
LLLFWKRRKWLNVEFCWGQAPRPPGSASPRFGVKQSSAKQNNAFCFFFWKKKNMMRVIYHEVSFWGARPPDPPGSASPRFGVKPIFCEAEQRFLLLFLEKEDYDKYTVLYQEAGFWGARPPRPPRVDFAEVWCKAIFCEAERRFLLLSGKRRILLDKLFVSYTYVWLLWSEQSRALCFSVSGRESYGSNLKHYPIFDNLKNGTVERP